MLLFKFIQFFLSYRDEVGCRYHCTLRCICWASQHWLKSFWIKYFSIFIYHLNYHLSCLPHTRLDGASEVLLVLLLNQSFWPLIGKVQDNNIGKCFWSKFARRAISKSLLVQFNFYLKSKGLYEYIT